MKCSAEKGFVFTSGSSSCLKAHLLLFLRRMTVLYLTVILRQWFSHLSHSSTPSMEEGTCTSKHFFHGTVTTSQLTKSVVFAIPACAREFTQFSIKKQMGWHLPTALPEQCSEVSPGHTAESFWTWPAFHKGNSYLPQESKNQRPRNWQYLLTSLAN